MNVQPQQRTTAGQGRSRAIFTAMRGCAPVGDRRPRIAAETLILLAALLLVTGLNFAFWRPALAGRAFGDLSTWRFILATYCGMVALNFCLLSLVATRHTARPLLSVIIALSAISGYFTHRYGVIIDAQMLRNVLHTDLREAAELMGTDTLIAMLLVSILAALPWCFRLRRRAFAPALLVRSGAWVASAAIAILAVCIVFQDLSSLLRNDRGLRHAITPANVLWALTQVIVDQAHARTGPSGPVETVERVHVAALARKPMLFVIVVGETARAANFSLNGYSRPTNPELARLNVINFPHATACGTSTEVSLPCMFSALGRAEYDATRIRHEESLLQLLARAGLRVVWVDNQSGCKGVCDGLEFRDVSREQIPGMCTAGYCYDEVLLRGLRSVAGTANADTVVVLHQMGNHGPAYFRRYPAAFKHFEPACERQELRFCSRDEIVNAYDNAIVYTDRFLADTIRFLDSQRARFDVAMLYVSDHGESLGELGLYLHGMPFAIAPKEQLEVPMLWWLPDGVAHDADLDLECLRARASQPASHDNIYHSLLGVLAVRTQRYRSDLDLFHACRAGTPASQRRLVMLDPHAHF